jgi:hypothetical protein
MCFLSKAAYFGSCCCNDLVFAANFPPLESWEGGSVLGDQWTPMAPSFDEVSVADRWNHGYRSMVIGTAGSGSAAEDDLATGK